MSGVVKGWCPSAHRPMMSGDGLLVRVRPHMARLDAAAVNVLCALARRFGNGMIDVTSRANLQLRGVSEDDHPAVLDALIKAELVHADPMTEASRILSVTPFWRPDDLTDRLAKTLAQVQLPKLPDKMGIVLDTGSAPQLQSIPGDFRFEQAATGALILRADGADLGRPVEMGQAAMALQQMVGWFLDNNGVQSGRMAKHLKNAALPKDWQTDAPALNAKPPLPGTFTKGALFGVPFGQTDADALETLIRMTGAKHIRVTPWRMLYLEGVQSCPVPGFLNGPDPLLNTAACPGAPACAQATVGTRDLARSLNAHVAGSLHVSGCAKGCASRLKADITLVGRDGRFDLVKQGRPGDTPVQSGLTKTDVLQMMAHNDAL